MKGPIALFLLVVFAPFVETLIMAGLFCRCSCASCRQPARSC